MKKLFILFVLVLFFGISNADEYTLDTPQPEVVPETVKFDWDDIFIRLSQKTMILYYSKVNVDGKSIPNSWGKTRREWTCRNMTDDPETPEDETDTCWSDVFMFTIRSQDVGTPIGRGLRQLIVNEMKADGVLGTGTFND